MFRKALSSVRRTELTSFIELIRACATARENVQRVYTKYKMTLCSADVAGFICAPCTTKKPHVVYIIDIYGKYVFCGPFFFDFVHTIIKVWGVFFFFCLHTFLQKGSCLTCKEAYKGHSTSDYIVFDLWDQVVLLHFQRELEEDASSEIL